VNEHRSRDEVPSYPDMALADLLESFSDATPAPGGGGAAAVAVALAASLCAMTARLSSRQIHDAPEIAGEALSIRDAIIPLCEQDARTYLDVIAARRLPGSPEPGSPELGSPEAATADPDDRRQRVAEALSRASDVPMATAEAGTRLAHLAARLALEGNPNLRGDAFVAAALAGAGVEAAVTLARINLAQDPGDDRHVRARALLEETTGWVDRARLATAEPSGSDPGRLATPSRTVPRR